MASNSEPLQSSSTSALEPILAAKAPRKFTRSRKPPAVKTAVIAKYAQGQDKTSIANDLGITRNTVRAIVNESDLDLHLSANQSASLDLIPEAIRVAKVRLQKDSEVMAIKVLENTIWPLNTKQSKTPDVGLTMAIQNLMLGNVQVNAQPATPNTSIVKELEQRVTDAKEDCCKQMDSILASASSTSSSDNSPQKA